MAGLSEVEMMRARLAEVEAGIAGARRDMTGLTAALSGFAALESTVGDERVSGRLERAKARHSRQVGRVVVAAVAFVVVVAVCLAGYGISAAFRTQRLTATVRDVQAAQLTASRLTRQVRDAATCNSTLTEVDLLDMFALSLAAGKRGQTPQGRQVIARLEATSRVLKETRATLRCGPRLVHVDPLPALPSSPG